MRGQSWSEVAQTLNTCPDNEGDVAKRTICAKHIPELDAMVTIAWLGELRELAIAPVVVATINDDTA